MRDYYKFCYESISNNAEFTLTEKFQKKINICVLKKFPFLLNNPLTHTYLYMSVYVRACVCVCVDIKCYSFASIFTRHLQIIYIVCMDLLLPYEYADMCLELKTYGIYNW